MSANTPYDYEQVGDEYHPFRQWFWKVAWMVQDYPLGALSWVFFELDNSRLSGKSEVDNLFVSEYTEDGDFSIELPDD